MLRPIALAAALLCCACTDQELQDFNSFAAALPTLTPDEQCSADGGQWQTSTLYDANGNVTGSSGTCVQAAPAPEAPRHKK